VAVFHIWHLERHQTTITILHPELLPSVRGIFGGDCLAGVGTGWFDVAPHARFAIPLQRGALSWANCDCIVEFISLPMHLE